MKMHKEFHMRHYLNLQECGQSEDPLEEDKTMKKIKKISVLLGEEYQKLDSQKED